MMVAVAGANRRAMKRVAGTRYRAQRWMIERTHFGVESPMLRGKLSGM